MSAPIHKSITRVLNKQTLGRAGEQLAVHYLENEGFRVIARNWRHQFGELDIVAFDAETIVAIEVKTRSSTDFGHPFESITTEKVQRLRRLLISWSRQHRNHEVLERVTARAQRTLRIDAVAIIVHPATEAEIEHLRGIG